MRIFGWLRTAAAAEASRRCGTCRWRDDDSAVTAQSYCVVAPPVMTVLPNGATRADYPLTKANWRCARWEAR